MCNITGVMFAVKNLTREQIENRKVIEIGSCDVNGSLRPIIESWKPSEYVGVDVAQGPGVDVVCDAKDIVDKFGREKFDIVLSTELLEHVEDWRRVISNFKAICALGGTILITTRSAGYEYHGFPYDFWRFDEGDFKHIFSDCDIVKLQKDTQSPGVFAIVRKPEGFSENNLSSYKLFSVVAGKRIRDLDRKQYEYFKKRYMHRQRIKETIKRIIYGLWHILFPQK